MFNQLLINYGTQVAIYLRIISLFILLLFIIPLQIKEVGVKNGLRTLRREMLIAGFLVLFIDATSLALLLILVDRPQQIENLILQVTNAIAFLAISLVGYHMYHTQYTDEIKEYHRKIDELEHS